MLQFDVYSWSPGGDPVCISPGDGAYFQSSIHPNGDNAVFWGGISGPPRIWRADLDGNSCEPLTPADSGARHPAYCPTGKRIMFVSDRGVKQAHETIETIFREDTTGGPRRDLILHIYSMQPDGTGVQQITGGPVQDQRPAIRPDGKVMCFVSTRGGSFGLWILALEGKAEPQKLATEVTLYRPCWSKDGQRIYGFTIVSAERHQAGWIDPQTGGWTPLQNDNLGATHCLYTDPCGDNLLIHSNRSGRWALYELPLDGASPPRHITPPGFDNLTCVHPTRAANRIMTFDSIPEASWARYKQGSLNPNY